MKFGTILIECTIIYNWQHRKQATAIFERKKSTYNGIYERKNKIDISTCIEHDKKVCFHRESFN